MPYQIIENTSDGLIVHNVKDAETALSLWYALDGEVETIKDEQANEIELSDVIALVAAKKFSKK